MLTNNDYILRFIFFYETMYSYIINLINFWYCVSLVSSYWCHLTHIEIIYLIWNGVSRDISLSINRR